MSAPNRRAIASRSSRPAGRARGQLSRSSTRRTPRPRFARRAAALERPRLRPRRRAWSRRTLSAIAYSQVFCEPRRRSKRRRPAAPARRRRRAGPRPAPGRPCGRQEREEPGRLGRVEPLELVVVHGRRHLRSGIGVAVFVRDEPSTTPADLQPVIGLLRENRPEATALELDAVKQRVRRRRRDQPARRRQSANLMKSRLAILLMLVLGMVFSTAGAGLAVTRAGGSRDASVSQYGGTETPGGAAGRHGGTSATRTRAAALHVDRDEGVHRAPDENGRGRRPAAVHRVPRHPRAARRRGAR